MDLMISLVPCLKFSPKLNCGSLVNPLFYNMSGRDVWLGMMDVCLIKVEKRRFSEIS